MSKRLKDVLMGVAALAALALGGSAIATAASGPDGSSGAPPAAEDRGSAEKDDAREEDDGREESENDASERVRGDGANRATAAALESTGGGRANEVERDSENGATWEVEVTKPNGRTVDVRLDESYRVVVEEGDSEEADETR